MNAKERGLLKGAIRRVFSRSDLRKQALEASRIEHKDDTRPRVTKWSRCAICLNPTPTYLIEIDHLVPVIPLDSTLEKMSWDEVIARQWCDIKNLQACCKPCHKVKSKAEGKLRREYKKKHKAV